MMPTAARLASASVKPLSNSFQGSGSRLATNFAGWGLALGVFLGWPMGIAAYENKVYKH